MVREMLTALEELDGMFRFQKVIKQMKTLHFLQNNGELAMFLY